MLSENLTQSRLKFQNNITFAKDIKLNKTCLINIKIELMLSWKK